MPIGKPTLVLVLALVVCTAASANQKVAVPVVVDLAHLEGITAHALGLGAEGVGVMTADACNRLELSDLQLQTEDGRLLLSLATDAATGVEIFGRCRGPGSISARLHVEMQPQLDADNAIVRFAPTGMALRRPDGERGLLTRPSQTLAERLVVPRLESVLVDLGGMLRALDELIGEFVPTSVDDAPSLVGRGQLSDVRVDEAGLLTQLDFVVRAPAQDLEPPQSEPALAQAEQAEWQRLEDELDGFMTVLIARLAAQVDQRDLQLDFLSLLLETRLRIAEALVDDDPLVDPVRALFVEAWTGLRPLLTQLEPGQTEDDRDLRLAGFIAGGDALSALDALGPEFGLDISRDGLRRLARLLMAGDAPASFTPLPLEEDNDLRRLFGLRDADALVRSRQPAPNWWPSLVPRAHAGVSPLAESLRGVVAHPANLDDYLNLVARLLDEIYQEHIDGGSRIPAEHRELFEPLVRATAWRESCWRHYVGPADQPRVIRSSVGAIGMMQIMGRVWRGMYDVNRLEAELEYNIAAGVGILEHYLVDYAIRRGEHEHPGGADNLVRATYAAYNGGPSHLSRYRRESTSDSLRAIDERFWREFEQIRAEGWPPVAGCFSVSP